MGVRASDADEAQPSLPQGVPLRWGSRQVPRAAALGALLLLALTLLLLLDAPLALPLRQALPAGLPPPPPPPHPCQSTAGARWVDSRSDAAFAAEYTLAAGGRDLALTLELPRCELRNLTHAAVTRCLRGRHLVFIGDSLARYQYLNLVQFLGTASWSFFARDAQLTESEREWKSWANFFRGTSARLFGHEICDCFRLDDTGGPNFEGAAENRYWHMPALGLRVSFISFMGTVHTPAFHALDWLNVTCNAGRSSPGQQHVLCAQAGCQPGACHQAAAPLAPWPAAMLEGALAQLAALAPVDALFINQGLFGNPGNLSAQGTAALVAPLLRARDRGQVRTLHWKTTTRSQRGPYDIALERAWVAANLLPQGFRVLDLGGLTEDGAREGGMWRLAEGMGGSATWDGLHFRPFAYRGFNQAMLAGLCSPGGMEPARGGLSG
jgi:hypothetical protein